MLGALDALGLSDSTRVVYSSDHGECLGARGLFGKFTMYDEAAAVPLIAAGPDVPEGHVVKTPVSLIDVFPTALECVGANTAEVELPGRSLWQTANESDTERTVLSEYHALGTEHACFMLRRRRYKYAYYVGAPPQLFDIEEDPDELNDLSTAPAHRTLVVDFERELRSILDPEAVDAQAWLSAVEEKKPCELRAHLTTPRRRASKRNFARTPDAGQTSCEPGMRFHSVGSQPPS